MPKNSVLRKVYGKEEYKKLMKKDKWEEGDLLIEPIDEDENISTLNTIPIEDPDLARKAWKTIKTNPIKKTRKRRSSKSEKSFMPDTDNDIGGLDDDDISTFFEDMPVSESGSVDDEEIDDESFFF